MKSELCSEAIFMEGQNYSKGIKAGKEERRNIPILLPHPRAFSYYEYPLLAGPNCRSSQPGAWVVQSLEVSSWGTEQGRGRRRIERNKGRGTNRQGWTTHQQCPFLPICVPVTFRNYFVLFSNVTIRISMGAHTLSGNWKQHFLGREAGASGFTPSLLDKSWKSLGL